MSPSTLLWRKSNNFSVEILDSPRRSKQILRNFDLLLPKFHFILPNFYFAPPWGIFVFQRATCRFLRRNSTFMRRNRRNSHVTKVLVLRCFVVLPWQADDPQWGCNQPPCKYKKKSGEDRSISTLCHFVIELGFEPKTYCLEGSCSIQLSYSTYVSHTPHRVYFRSELSQARRHVQQIKKQVSSTHTTATARQRYKKLSLLPKTQLQQNMHANTKTIVECSSSRSPWGRLLDHLYVGMLPNQSIPSRQ